MLTEEEISELDEETQQELRAIQAKRQQFEYNSDTFIESLCKPTRVIVDISTVHELQEHGRRMREEEERPHREALLLQRQKLKKEDDHDAAAHQSQQLMGPSPNIVSTGAGPYESRDSSVSKTLSWLRNYHTHDRSETLLGPMRYTFCEVGGNCLHDATPMLQVFDILVKCYLNNDIADPYMLLTPGNTMGPFVEVYGMCAIRDCLDNSRNYIYHQSRENAQVINASGGYLRLRNPTRGISAVNYLIEIDIKVKADEISEDVTIIEGCLKGTGQFDPCKVNHVYTMDGRVTFNSCVFTKGVEATIELDFLEVPDGGFHIQMCGNTIVSKDLYSFITERRECDDLVVSAGMFKQKFVAAVSMGDTLRIDFMEKGRDGLFFAASKHGNEQQIYRFGNGAVVSVKVYWSTTGTGDLVIDGRSAE
ncbi:hypothetical protein ACP70R_018158 [Stipagrostis hirtigluma subsp. patula]